jgi:hypothetical protein
MSGFSINDDELSGSVTTVVTVLSKLLQNYFGNYVSVLTLSGKFNYNLFVLRYQ